MAASKEFPSGSLSRHIKFFALSVSILILAFGFDISGLSIFFPSVFSVLNLEEFTGFPFQIL